MECQKCGYKNEDNTKYCISCGSRFQNVTSSNQQTTVNGQKFDNKNQQSYNQSLDYQPNNQSENNRQ